MDRPAGGHGLALACLLALSFCLYLPMRDAPFMYEDTSWLKAVSAPVGWQVPSRALTVASYQAQAGVAVDPKPFHTANFLLHLTNGALVAAVALPMVGATTAVFAASVFLLHPLNSEAVSYVSARPDLLLTFFALVAVLAAWRGGWWWALAGSAFVGAAMSKEIGLVVVPCVALTVVLWKRPAFQMAAAPLWLGLGLVVGAMWPVMTNWLTLPLHAGGSSLLWTEILVRQLAAVWRLLALFVWPVGFTVDHDMYALGEPWRLAVVGLTMLAAVGIVLAWRRWPVVAWSLGWMVMSLAPRLIFQSSEWINEHQMYLPMVGVSVLGGLVLEALWRGKGFLWLSTNRTSINRIPPCGTPATATR